MALGPERLEDAMNLFLLFLYSLGGKKEDPAGIAQVWATGTRDECTATLPDGCTERELTADEEAFLKSNSASVFKLMEVPSPGLVDDVISTTWFYPADLGA